MHKSTLWSKGNSEARTAEVFLLLHTPARACTQQTRCCACSAAYTHYHVCASYRSTVPRSRTVRSPVAAADSARHPQIILSS